MSIELPNNLLQLAEIFAPVATLFLVGGAVRDSLLGREVQDYDIASKLQPNEVEKLLQNSKFEIVASYKRTGTLVIKCDTETYEYTTFRQDSYPLSSGSHSPIECVFTEDIEVDAKRRDFTVNALYYDIKAEKIVDLVGGVADIKNKILRTVREPSETLSEDSLRIMRLVRFAVQLNSSIEDRTFEVAQKYSGQLKDISKERIHDELMLILQKSIYSGAKASDGIRNLVELGAMEYIIPEVLDMIDIPQNPKYHIYDVYNHSLATMDNLPLRLMLAGLLHDIAKPVLLNECGNMYGHEIRGAEMARNILTRLKFSNSEIESISRLVEIHMFDVDGRTRKSKCRVFIADNIDYFDDFIMLRRADGMATNPNNYDDKIVQKLIDIKNQMIVSGIPMKVKDLPVSGNDLLSLGYEGKEIGDMLAKIRLWVLHNGILPSKEEMITKLRRDI